MLTLLISVNELVGQQAPVFTQYRQTQMFTNPAYAGMREGICVNGLMRQQWAGFKDYETGDNASPEDYLVTLDSPIRFLHGGLGGVIIQDRPTYTWNDVSLLLSYSYHLEFTGGTLGIGVGGVLKNRNIDGSLYRYVDNDDPVILTTAQGDMRFDANLGVFYQSLSDYYVGFSVTNILKSTFKKLDQDSNGELSTDRTFYFIAGYKYIMPADPRFELEPSVLIQSDLYSTQYNVSGTVTYNSKFLAGLNYRFQESVGVMIGVRFKDFRIGYAYDVVTKTMGLPGSHEVSLNYCFKLKPDRSKTSYKNTRYL